MFRFRKPFFALAMKMGGPIKNLYKHLGDYVRITKTLKPETPNLRKPFEMQILTHCWEAEEVVTELTEVLQFNKFIR